jgi:hypothetical protein
MYVPRKLCEALLWSSILVVNPWSTLGKPMNMIIFVYKNVLGIVPCAAVIFCMGDTPNAVDVWSDGKSCLVPSLAGDTNPWRGGDSPLFCTPPIAANSLEILPLAKPNENM